MPPGPSGALVNRGPSGVSKKQGPGGITRSGRHGATTLHEKHTTSLVLRGGQNGIWGTGEIMLKGGHYSGPQKLAARANMLITSGLLPPFNFSKLLNMSWAQCDMSLRTVERLADERDFYRDMNEALRSRPEVVFATRRSEKRDFLKYKPWVATQIAARIHNVFFAASAWRMIWTILVHIAEHIREDVPIRQQLGANEKLRAYFLILYDCINDVIEAGRQQVSQLVIASPYYSRYFTESPDGRMEFSAEHIRDAHKSLTTTIVLELALTDSTYPLNILMSCLGDVVADAPKNRHRISQGLWDAIGDLSVAVEFRGYLDAAIIDHSANYKNWFSFQPSSIEGYHLYKEAISLSEEAARDVDNILDLVVPLERTMSPVVLDQMWKAVNDTYTAVTGKNIERLWLLEGAWDPAPKLRTFFIPHLDGDDREDATSQRVALRRKQVHGKAEPPKRRLEIANKAYGSDTDDDIPDLLDVTDSSDEEESESEASDPYDDGDEDDESDYDEDDMEHLDDLMQEALRYHFESPEDNPAVPSDISNNPFIRMMKSLKGRFATLDPRSRPTEQTRIPDARLKVKNDRPVFGPPRPPPPKKADATRKPAVAVPPSMKVTVVEVSDEEAGGVSAAKKKKKKKKKKKSANKTDALGTEQINQPPMPVPVLASPPPSSPIPAHSPAAVTPKSAQQSKKKTATPAPKPAQVNPLIREYDPSSSLLSLSLGPETAQSARSYLMQQGNESKAKIKSRPVELAPKKSLFTRLRRAARGEDEEQGESKPTSGPWNLFAGVKRRLGKTLKQIIAPSRDERGKKGMRWEEFERAMVSLGFTIDGTTAGSSVRFTPASGEPISFHKPHPDSTIHPIMLLEMSRRLKEKYQWTEEMVADFEE